MNIQCRSGLLELCVLSILSRKDSYGFELVEEVSKSVKISKGTIYPTMRRLVKSEMVDFYFSNNAEGPKRKYYKLTDTGKKQLDSLNVEWERLKSGVTVIVGGEGLCNEKSLSQN